MNRPDAICFDAFGTLFDPGGVATACERRFPGRGGELASRWRQAQLRYAWIRSLMRRYRDFDKVTEEALRYALEALELTPSDQEVAELCAAFRSLDPFPDVPEGLARLAGVRLALLSNGTPEQLEAMTRCAGLRDRFELLLSADTVRSYKPDPQVYELAERQLELPRERIGFVTANAWDAAGAASFGLRVAFLARDERPCEALGPSPERVLHDLRELADAWR